MTFQRQDHETCHLKFLCKQESAAKGFLEIPFVRFGLDKLHAAGGEGENHPADLSCMPGFTFMTSCNAWGEGCGLAGDQEVCGSWIKQVTVFLQSKGLLPNGPAWGVNMLLWWLYKGYGDRGTLKNHHCPSSQTSSWRRLWESHLGAHRAPPSHCTHAGPPLSRPQLLLVTKALPSICYRHGFHGSFWANGFAIWFKRRAVQSPSQKNSSIWTSTICLQVLYAQIIRHNFFTTQKPRLA